MPEDAPAADQATQETPEESGPETQAPAEDAPTQEAPQPADDPFEKRYNDLRPQYDRTQSELSQYKEFIQSLTDSETQGEALERLGLQLEQSAEAEDEYVDSDQRIERVEQWIQEQANEAREAEAADLEKRYIDQEIGKLDDELTDDEKQVLTHLARAELDNDGIPDVAAAYERLTKAADVRHKRYVESKKAPKVEVGTAGSEKVNLADDDARVDLLANMIEAGEQADS